MNATTDNLTKFKRFDWNKIEVFRHGEYLGPILMRLGTDKGPDGLLVEKWTVNLSHMRDGKLPGEKQAKVFATLKEAKRYAKEQAPAAFKAVLNYYRKHQPSEYERLQTMLQNTIETLAAE